jgi:hypothetical protein
MKYVTSDQPSNIGADQIQIQPPQTTFTNSLLRFAGDIKIAHSVFALPFAATALVMVPVPQLKFSQVAFLFFCMVVARSFDM